MYNEEQEITEIAAHHDGVFVFSGHEDGAIRVFSTTQGNYVQSLNIQGDNIAISLLVWNQKLGLLAVIDGAGRILVH
jgi:hypothetical protein